MAEVLVRSYNLLSCFYVIFSILAQIAVSIPSLSGYSKIDFDTNITGRVTLFGDAHFVNDGSSVQLTRGMPSSSGLVIHRKSFKFVDFNSVRPSLTSFASDFTFSISPHNGGDGIAFLIVPVDFPMKFSGKDSFGLYGVDNFLGFKFHTSTNGNAGDANANHVGFAVEPLGSVKICNLSSINLVLNSGVKLHSWVEYDASSKKLEVRLSEFGDTRPYDPLLTCQIDLFEMWNAAEMFVGISSSNGNSQQTSSVYSWRFRVRNVPKWLHSLPVNPQVYSRLHNEQITARRKKACPLSFLSGLILATGCGALVAFIVLFLWAIIFSRNKPLSGDEFVHPVDFRYEKVCGTIEHSSGDFKN